MSTASTASTASSSEPDTFREMWGYPNEVIKTIPGAAGFEVYPVPGLTNRGALSTRPYLCQPTARK